MFSHPRSTWNCTHLRTITQCVLSAIWLCVCERASDGCNQNYSDEEFSMQSLARSLSKIRCVGWICMQVLMLNNRNNNNARRTHNSERCIRWLSSSCIEIALNCLLAHTSRSFAETRNSSLFRWFICSLDSQSSMPSHRFLFVQPSEQHTHTYTHDDPR